MCECKTEHMLQEGMNYSNLLKSPHSIMRVCVCVSGFGGVFVLYLGMCVQSCLITDQALRQSQTVL